MSIERGKRPAVSQLGRCSGCVNIEKGRLLIALRAYLDSSGKLANQEFVTLAAVASSDEIWSRLETEWQKILSSQNPPVDYLHMREIFYLNHQFDKDKGWTHDSACGVVNQCLMYMAGIDKKRFKMFYCTIDMKAYAKLRAETYQMPEPIWLCNATCTETVLRWYLKRYPDIIDPANDTVSFFFDKNECFEPYFRQRWKEEVADDDEQEKTWSIWRVISEVASVDMRKTPGIQAADIVAWGANRENFAGDGELHKFLALVMRSAIPSEYILWNEEKLRQQFKPLIYLP